MGAPALLWPFLMLSSLIVLFGQPPGTVAQGCSVNQTVFEVVENTNVSEPLLNISTQKDYAVTLGDASTPSAFKVDNNQLFLTVIPDYEENSLLQAVLECKRGNVVVTQLQVFVVVLDVNDNAPQFSFTIKEFNVREDTAVGTTVVPETELKATDADKDDTLYYTLQEVTPNASSFFSLVSVSYPGLMLTRSLDFYKNQNMTFKLLARDTWEEDEKLNHTATATVVLTVLPADLRTPWFLPCSFSDGYSCVHAQYHGVVPTGHTLPSPVILSPGPIYAVDGDQGINERIIYSIVNGNTDDTFIINADSGNLTMAKSIPDPMTFILIVRADQADKARYSVTQAVVEARSVTGVPLQFSQSPYLGTVVLGSEAGTAVKDKIFPSEILRIQAQYPGFLDLNLAFTYQVTNSSEFAMRGDIVLTTVPMEQAGVFYIEVEATNTVTNETATTVVEIRVSEREPTESPTPPEAGGTTGPSSSTTLESPTTSGTSQGPATTSAGGSAGPFPPTGTTLSPPASSPIPGGLPTLGTSTSPQTATPSGGSTQTPKPGTSQPLVPITGTSTSPQTATPSGGSTQTPKPGTSQPLVPITGTSTSPQTATPSGGSTETPKPGTSQPLVPITGTSTSSQPATPSGGSKETPKPGTSQPLVPITGASTSFQPTTPSGASTPAPKPGTSQPTATGPIRSPPPSGEGELGDGQRFSTVDMAVLGGVLGALLLLALIGLVILIHKHYRHRLNCCSGKAAHPQPNGYDNLTFMPDQKTNWSTTSDSQPEPGPEPSKPPSEPPSPMSSSPTPPSSAPPSPVPRASGSPNTVQAGDSPSAVRSILTKERRPEGEGGYKAVWFGKDIGAEADVVVLNEPTADADSASASGSESSEDDDPGQNTNLHLHAGVDNTYI